MISKKFRDEIFVNFLLSLIPLGFFITASSWEEAKEMARPIFTLMAVAFVLSFLPKDPQMEAFMKNGTRRYLQQMHHNRNLHRGSLFSPFPHSGHLFNVDFLNTHQTFGETHYSERYQQPPQENPEPEPERCSNPQAVDETEIVDEPETVDGPH